MTGQPIAIFFTASEVGDWLHNHGVDYGDVELYELWAFTHHGNVWCVDCPHNVGDYAFVQCADDPRVIAVYQHDRRW